MALQRTPSSNLTRDQVVLAALTPAGGAAHTPVQVQKLMFLLDRRLPEMSGHFHFTPYHYGPFDQNVYHALDALANQGLVEIVSTGKWRNYRLTAEGQALGQAVVDGLSQRAASYLSELSRFVRHLSFSQLVSAIYKAYPEMRANSVFQG